MFWISLATWKLPPGVVEVANKTHRSHGRCTCKNLQETHWWGETAASVHVLLTQRKGPPAEVQMDELEAREVKEGQPKRCYIGILSYAGSSLLRVRNSEEVYPPNDLGVERDWKGRIHYTNHCLARLAEELRRSRQPLWD